MKKMARPFFFAANATRINLTLKFYKDRDVPEGEDIKRSPVSSKSQMHYSLDMTSLLRPNKIKHRTRIEILPCLGTWPFVNPVELCACPRTR